MPSSKILRIANDTALEAPTEWQEVLSEFDVISVAGLADAQAALACQDVDCVLVVGPIPDGDRMIVLEAIRDIDGVLPVVFYDCGMTAAEAVRLHRSGAYNCLGYRDSLESLRECLEHAVEDRRCQAGRRFSTARTVARHPGGRKSGHPARGRHHPPGGTAPLHRADHR
jgi:DNA-binding NtrC family response regulator